MNQKAYCYLNEESGLVEVNVSLYRGLPYMRILGASSKLERDITAAIKSAFKNSSIPYPNKKVTVEILGENIDYKELFHNKLVIGTLVFLANNKITLPTKSLIHGDIKIDGKITISKGYYSSLIDHRFNLIGPKKLTSLNLFEFKSKGYFNDNLINLFHKISNKKYQEVWSKNSIIHRCNNEIELPINSERNIDQELLDRLEKAIQTQHIKSASHIGRYRNLIKVNPEVAHDYDVVRRSVTLEDKEKIVIKQKGDKFLYLLNKQFSSYKRFGIEYINPPNVLTF